MHNHWIGVKHYKIYMIKTQEDTFTLGDKVGDKTISCLEQIVKTGPQGDVPYVRVWLDDELWLEFCQHYLLAVEFEKTIRVR